MTSALVARDLARDELTAALNKLEFELKSEGSTDASIENCELSVAKARSAALKAPAAASSDAEFKRSWAPSDFAFYAEIATREYKLSILKAERKGALVDDKYAVAGAVIDAHAAWISHVKSLARTKPEVKSEVGQKHPAALALSAPASKRLKTSLSQFAAAVTTAVAEENLALVNGAVKMAQKILTEHGRRVNYVVQIFGTKGRYGFFLWWYAEDDKTKLWKWFKQHPNRDYEYVGTCSEFDLKTRMRKADLRNAPSGGLTRVHIKQPCSLADAKVAAENFGVASRISSRFEESEAFIAWDASNAFHDRLVDAWKIRSSCREHDPESSDETTGGTNSNGDTDRSDSDTGGDTDCSDDD